MIDADDDAMRRDWDARARHAMRLYVATWYAHSDETWAEGTRRDAAFLMRQLPPALGPGQACLDLGCGAGRLLTALAERFERVTGVDVSPEMLRQAQSVADTEPRITLRATDGRTLDGLPDAGFHFVLANAVFIHCQADVVHGLLAEVGRVLAPGGMFAGTFNREGVPLIAEATDDAPDASPLASPPASGSDEPAPAAFPTPQVTEADLALLGGPTWDGARYTRPALDALLADAGLQPEDVQPMDAAWSVVARRVR